MKKATVAVFLLLSVLMAFGRNVTDQEVASALKSALRERDHLNDTAEVQVSSALATGKDICIEYRASTASGQSVSGLAVYRTEDELLFLDNSWIWERACLSGKYGQRRNGKDLTHALNASLAAPVTVKPAAVVAVAAPPPAPAAPPVPKSVVVASAPVQPPIALPATSVAATPFVASHAGAPSAVSVQQAAAPLAVPVPAAVPIPAPVPTLASIPALPAVAKAAPSAPAAIAIPAPTPTQVVAVVATPPAPAPAPVAAAAPVQVVAVAAPPAPAASAVVAKPAAIVSAQPTPIVMASMTAPPPPPAVATVAQPAPIASAPVVSAPTVSAQPLAQASLAGRNPAASTETTLHGVTIIDNNGALGSPTSTASSTGPVESLAEVARRVRGQRTMQ